MKSHKLFTDEHLDQLLINGLAADTDKVRPVVKLSTPDANATWLIS